MDVLKKKRKTLRAQVTKLMSEAEDLLQLTTAVIDELEILIERLSLARDQLNNVDAAIEPLITERDAEAEFTQVMDYTDKIVTCLTKLRKKAKGVENCQQASGSSNDERRATPVKAKIKLPQLELIKFNGDRKNWQPFWEQFETTIHKNPELTPSEKFNYLRSALIGGGSAAIQGLQPTAQCYADAIELLKQRFGKQEALVHDHMKSLMDIQKLPPQGSARALRRLYDSLQAHIRGLRALGVGEESYCAMLYPVLLRALPRDMSLDYNRKVSSEDTGNATAPTGDGPESPSENVHLRALRTLLKFIRVEVESRERTSEEQEDDFGGKPAIRFPKEELPKKLSNYRKLRNSTAAALHGRIEGLECLFCNSKEHATPDCNAKIELTEKKRRLQADNRCFRCTKANHTARMCRSTPCCRKCHGRHVLAMCDPSFIPERKAARANEASKPKNVSATPVSLQTRGRSARKPAILLQTVTAWVETGKNRKLARIMFDSGSQRSFITEELSKRLNCRLLGTEILTVGVFGGDTSERTLRRVQVNLRDQRNRRLYEIDALETPTICEQDLPSPDESILTALVELGCPVGDDVTGLEHYGVDILLGSDHYWECVTGRILRLSSNLTAVETVFGWAVQGRTEPGSAVVSCSQAIVLRATTQESELTSTLRHFWELESIGVTDTSTEDLPDDSLKLDFEAAITKVNGRYEVGLPWKSNVQLADNKDVAKKRLENLRKKLTKNSDLLQRYDEAIRFYSDNGIAEKVEGEPENEDSTRVYYMPHQAVLRESSTTTKLRIVFDASSHSANSKSLNDNLESGPNLNPDLVALLLSFRTHPVALLADVEKAFLQIGVRTEDRDAMRFLWYKEPPQSSRTVPEIETWRMTRVTFGTTSSPFLLSATLQHHYATMEKTYPETVGKLSKSVYVDDLLTGAADEHEAKTLYAEANEIFQRAGMKLHKWCSNSEALRDIFREDSASERPLGQVAGVLKVLGVTWRPDEDSLTFTPEQVIQFAHHQGNTKRFVLQTTTRLYDPLGFLSPFVVRAKILFQEIWKRNLHWDEVLPDQILSEWTGWCQELPELGKIKVPRFYDYQLAGNVTHRALHIFADASTAAYGAVIYLCTTDDAGASRTTLLLAKGRVAPLKTVTLARLELMAGLIASRLYKYVQTGLQIEVNEVHFWTDAMITLFWIRGEASRWKLFVKNRVQEIQNNCQGATWHHCPGKENPADLMTRGLTASRLVSAPRWWSGPSWLPLPATEWPKEKSEEPPRDKLEERGPRADVLDIISTPSASLIDVTTFSSASRLNRTTAWMFRFLHNVRSTKKRSGPLTAEEIQGARTYWLKEAQRSAFSAELRRATNRTETLPTSPLRDFSTFIDQEGVLRIRGRLRSDNMTYDERNPIVLPKQHRYSTLLVIDAHRMMLHAGVRDTLVQLRERYWILRGRELVKKVLRGCVTCQRFSATPASAPTGPLPCTRTTQAEPFEVVGVDFAGPLYIQAKEVTHKSYITLFTCAVTRAVHLELVPDISTRSFLLAFRRFVSRRGLCRIIYSDNALTFKRASKDLAELWKILRHSEVVNHFANATIEWRFIVERAPWWGGFYERLVRSVKVGLRKVIGRKSMDAEELSTVLCEIEAVLNSRPLTFVYNELHEGQPLTPASFLTGRRLTALPVAETEDLASSPEVLRQMWKRRKAFLNRLWETWRSEYLRELRSAYESKGRQSPRLEVGQFVLLKEQLPRLLWKMGRVEKVFCGRDGKIRACIVRTNKGGLLKRPIQLLYPLEITEI